MQALSSASLPGDLERPSAFDGLVVSAASAPLMERFDAPDEAATIELNAYRSPTPAPSTPPRGSRRAVVLVWLIAAGIVLAVFVRMALR
jgi:hypothetical protein